MIAAWLGVALPSLPCSCARVCNKHSAKGHEQRLNGVNKTEFMCVQRNAKGNEQEIHDVNNTFAFELVDRSDAFASTAILFTIAISFSQLIQIHSTYTQRYHYVKAKFLSRLDTLT